LIVANLLTISRCNIFSQLFSQLPTLTFWDRFSGRRILRFARTHLYLEIFRSLCMTCHRNFCSARAFYFGNNFGNFQIISVTELLKARFAISHSRKIRYPTFLRFIRHVCYPPLFLSTISQCPPLSGPMRFNIPAFFSFATTFSTVLCDNLVIFAISWVFTN